MRVDSTPLFRRAYSELLESLVVEVAASDGTVYPCALRQEPKHVEVRLGHNPGDGKELSKGTGPAKVSYPWTKWLRLAERIDSKDGGKASNAVIGPDPVDARLKEGDKPVLRYKVEIRKRENSQELVLTVVSCPSVQEITSMRNEIDWEELDDAQTDLDEHKGVKGDRARDARNKARAKIRRIEADKKSIQSRMDEMQELLGKWSLDVVDPWGVPVARFRVKYEKAEEVREIHR